MTPREYENKATFAINRDWSYAVDTFGRIRAKEYADEYRQRAKYVYDNNITFADWCLTRAKDDATYTGPAVRGDLQTQVKRMFPKGCKIRIIEEREGHTPPAGEICSVKSVDRWGFVHISWMGQGLALGKYTGITDKNGVDIFEGNIVKIADFQIGQVVFECGAFGIAVMPYIDWDYLDSEIAEYTGCNNRPLFCRNDNFISLWEIMWNYNQEENNCNVVEVIGNIHDNPEFLKGGAK